MPDPLRPFSPQGQPIPLALTRALLSALLLFPPAGAAALERFELSQPQMGVPFRIVLYAEDETFATQAAEAAFKRISELNQIMSDYETESELSRLSRTSGRGEAIRVSPELWQVLEPARQLSVETEGAFDVTVGPAVNLWRKARREGQFPRADLLEMVRSRTGYRHMVLEPDTRSVRLLVPGMRLDLGGIAKGYAVDQALAVLEDHGIQRALVAGDGDIRVSEAPPGRAGWRIALASPSGAPDQFLLLRHHAVSTSGDLFQYVEIDGVRYSHIVDPRTGIGLTNQLLVTVLAPEAMLSDSLATAISVLGPGPGLKLLEHRPRTAARILSPADGATGATVSAAFGQWLDE